MGQIVVRVVADYFAEDGVSTSVAEEQAAAWAEEAVLHEVTLAKAGCSIMHSVVPLSFNLTVIAESDDVEATVRTWMKGKPIIARSVSTVAR